MTGEVAVRFEEQQPALVFLEVDLDVRPFPAYDTIPCRYYDLC